MNGQRTVKYVLSISLVILLCGNLRAGPTFRDDFSDGDVQDGAPVSWGWDDDGLGERLVTPEGFRLVPSLVSNPAMRPWAVVLDDEGKDALYAGNVTIRMQLRMDSPSDWGNTGVLFRAARAGNDYMAGIILNQLFLGRFYNGTWTVLSQPTIPGFSPTGQDIIIEIDVTDFTDATGQRMSRLEVYCWFPGQTKPAQPQISAVDGTLAQGTIVLYAERCSVTFRWVEVVAEPTEPVVDFNGDGTVDIQDLLKMIQSWGQDEPFVDISGDGTVDREDLEVLMDYWGRDVNDPTLLAHWAFDEAQGDLACDSTGRAGRGSRLGPPGRSGRRRSAVGWAKRLCRRALRCESSGGALQRIRAGQGRRPRADSLVPDRRSELADGEHVRRRTGNGAEEYARRLVVVTNRRHGWQLAPGWLHLGRLPS